MFSSPRRSCRTLVGGSLVLLLSSCGYDKAPDITVEANPQRLARGRYLTNHVTGCIDCHSRRNFDYFAGPVVPGTEGMGGELFDESMGLPGKIYATNITPARLRSWSDGELFRVITSGVNKDGKPLFPMMPYLNFNHLSREDVYSIIAYLRAIKPIETEKVPERKLKFPVSLIVRTMPVAYEDPKAPDPSDALAYGKYLVTIGSCADCHTPTDEKGTRLEGMDYAGGTKFPLPSGATVAVSNITPDKETGIGKMTREEFVERFKKYDNEESREIEIHEAHKGRNTVMPWILMAGTTREDLSAMHTFLISRKPVVNKVEKYDAPEPPAADTTGAGETDGST